MPATDQILATFLTKVATAYREALEQHEYARLAEAARAAEQLAAVEVAPVADSPAAAPPAHTGDPGPAFVDPFNAGRVGEMDLSTPLSRVTYP